MSGHSKWAKIKRAKGANDAKRGALFTKLAKNITIAASEAGGDPDMNFALRLAIEKAKAANMPADNITRAIKKGTGEGEKVQIQRISYEALGPGGVSLMIDCQTDNTNRTVSEVRKLIENHGGKMVPGGSIAWQFVERGLITILSAVSKKAEKFGAEDTYEDVSIDEVQMSLLDIEGILDINIVEHEIDGNQLEALEVTTDKVDFSNVLKAIEDLSYRLVSAELIKEPKESVNVSAEDMSKLTSLIESVDDHDDVDSVWTNSN